MTRFLFASVFAVCLLTVLQANPVPSEAPVTENSAENEVVSAIELEFRAAFVNLSKEIEAKLENAFGNYTEDDVETEEEKKLVAAFENFGTVIEEAIRLFASNTTVTKEEEDKVEKKFIAAFENVAGELESVVRSYANISVSVNGTEPEFDVEGAFEELEKALEVAFAGASNATLDEVEDAKSEQKLLTALEHFGEIFGEVIEGAIGNSTTSADKQEREKKEFEAVLQSFVEDLGTAISLAAGNSTV